MKTTTVIEKIITTIGCKDCTGIVKFCFVCKKDFKIGDEMVCHCLEHEHKECYNARVEKEKLEEPTKSI